MTDVAFNPLMPGELSEKRADIALRSCPQDRQQLCPFTQGRGVVLPVDVTRNLNS